ncbi:MAG: FG-GAP repeat protein [Phycisphaerales bacterium]|nr:MAG: FG-GAP repeat protein [Phycisphaerales bacterium]
MSKPRVFLAVSLSVFLFAAALNGQIVEWTETAKLTASDGTEGDEFGHAISIDGDLAIVGAYRDDVGGGYERGSAYIYRFDGSAWVEEQKLSVPSPQDADRFGSSVSISGDVAIVGAVWDDCSTYPDNNCGAAYIFRYNGSSWVLERRIVAADNNQGDSFGYSVSVSGDAVVVGAPGADCVAGDACGAAYVFRFNGSTWVQEQKLTALDAEMGATLGISVSISGIVAVVGAEGDDCGAGPNCGAVYVYRYNGATWVEEQKLTAPTPTSSDWFGTAVSLEMDVAVVGAYGADYDATVDSGAAYVFRFNGASWDTEQELGASDAAQDAEFGRAVSVSGNAIVVGAWLDDGAHGPDDGSGYVFRFDGATWTEEQKLTASDGASDDSFGFAVAVDGDIAFVGADGHDCEPTGEGCGAVYVYNFTSCFEEDQKLRAPDAEQNDQFGQSVSVSGDVAFVGVSHDFCPAGDCGSVRVYRFDGASWIEEQKLTGSDDPRANWFGYAVSVDGDVAVVGAFHDQCGAGASCGAAYVFRYNGSTWEEEQKLTASDAALTNWYGYSVSISGDVAVVGAYGQECVAGPDCGAAYVYRFNGSTWVEEQKLIASDIDQHSEFGYSVSLSNDVVVVGASGDDCETTGYDCGAAYVFRYIGSAWVEEQKLYASDANTSAWFGYSVSVRGDDALIGAGLDDSAYVFYYDGGSWTEVQKLTPWGTTGAAGFGVSVDLSSNGNEAVVGAWRHECPEGDNCGAAYVFRSDGLTWVEYRKLTACDVGAGDRYGQSVSIDDSTVFVGANFDDCEALPDCGSAYVYELPEQPCEEEQILATGSEQTEELFGISVSVAGDLAVVGAYVDRCVGDGSHSGSAFVYSSDGTYWTEEQQLCASDRETGDHFGKSVSASGTAAVVGAPSADCAEEWDCGAAYVYRYNGSSWVEEQKLTAPSPSLEDYFGESVSISGDVVVVGAPSDGAGSLCNASAYVYRFNGSTWIAEQTLTAGTCVSYGGSVSVSGDIAVVGDPLAWCGGPGYCGAAHVYRFNGSTWLEEQTLNASDATEFDEFGSSVSVSGDAVVVGATQDDCVGAESCGSAYVFRYNGSSWVEEQKLVKPEGGEYDYFGSSVSIDGGTAVVGLWGHDCPAGSNCGSAYVYRFDESVWIEEQRLVGSNTNQGDYFGMSVSVSGGIVVAGAPNGSGPVGGDGSAYVFTCFGDESPPVEPPAGASDPKHAARKHRYISFDPSTNAGNEVAYKVELVEMLRCQADLRRTCSVDTDCPGVCDNDSDITCTGDPACMGGTCVPSAPCVHHPDEGLTWWVQEPEQEPLGCRLPGGCTDEDWFARLDTTPLFRTWNNFGVADSSLLHISDCQITPVATYEVRGCALPDGSLCSDPLVIGTILRPPPGNYGDVVGPVDPVTIEFDPPNQILSVGDVSGYLLTNQNYGLPGDPKPQAHWTWVDMEGQGAPFYRPQAILNVGDLNQILFGIMGRPYSWAGNNVDPGDCP